MRLKIPALLLVAAAGGCVAETGVGYHAAVVAPAPVVVTPTVSAEVEVAPAANVEVDLVEVEPGIQVVYDYDEPVFFNDGFYWRFYGGTWYRSSVHTGGWVVYNDPPARIRGIRNPHTYAHYRPANYTPRHARATPVVNGTPGRRVEPARGAPVVNGTPHGAPVVNGNAGYHGAAGTPVVNGTAHGAAGTPVVNGTPAKAAPVKAAPKKEDRDHRK